MRMRTVRHTPHKFIAFSGSQGLRSVLDFWSIIPAFLTLLYKCIYKVVVFVFYVVRVKCKVQCCRVTK